MVILQFNRLIRNKWVWGVFAVVISAVFCFDDLLTTREREERNEGSAGLLGDKFVSMKDFTAAAEDVRGVGRNRDWRRKNAEVNREAWETLAALAVAERNGIAATDADIQTAIRSDSAFAVNNQFSFARYQALLRENSIQPERFEEFLRRRITLQRVAERMMGAADWVAPAELDRAVADVTDRLTVRIADFDEDAAAKDKVTVDEAGLKKWYDENAKSLDLPERVRVRLVRFDATEPALLAKMTLTDDEMHDFYDANSDKYSFTDTNGVESVRSFDEVKDKVDAELRRLAAVQCLETNLTQLAYSVKAAEGKSRLDEIAAERSASVVTSDWFAVDGSYAEGFTVPASSVCPGVANFQEAVSQLDPSYEDARYAVICSDSAAWLVELADKSPAHTPTFDEAKEVVRPRALEAAQAEAFKKSVQDVIAKGTNEIFKAAKNVSSNYTFAVCEMKPGAFPNQYQVAFAANKLAKGGISDFVPVAPGKAVVIVCENREAGDVTQATLMKSQIRNQVAMLQRQQLPEAWKKWNLERLGFAPDEAASVTEVEEE